MDLLFQSYLRVPTACDLNHKSPKKKAVPVKILYNWKSDPLLLKLCSTTHCKNLQGCRATYGIISNWLIGLLCQGLKSLRTTALIKHIRTSNIAGLKNFLPRRRFLSVKPRYSIFIHHLTTTEMNAP